MQLLIPPPLIGLVIAVIIWGIDRLLLAVRLVFEERYYRALLFGFIGVLIEVISVRAFIHAYAVYYGKSARTIQDQ